MGSLLAGTDIDTISPRIRTLDGALGGFVPLWVAGSVSRSATNWGIVGVVLEDLELVIKNHVILWGHESGAEVEYQCD